MSVTDSDNEGPPARQLQASGRALAAPTASSLRASKTARLRRTNEGAQRDADRLRLQDWVESRPPAKPQQRSADERMAALRARMAERAHLPT